MSRCWTRRFSALVNQASTYHVDGSVPGRMGNAHPTVVPYEVFATADGHIILACGNDGQSPGSVRRLGSTPWLPTSASAPIPAASSIAAN